MTAFVAIKDGKLTEVTSAFTFNQDVPDDVWTINHPLGKYPSVTVVDSSNRVVEGSVEYVSSDTVTVTFSAGFSGLAYLN